MIKLSDVFIVDLVVHAVLGAILTFLILVVLRIACAKMKVLLPFAKLKLRYMMLFVIAGSILLSIGVAGIVKVSSTRDISTLLQKLRTCTSLKAHNSFFDREAYKSASEDILIENREIIDKLVAVMDSAIYKRSSRGGFIDSRNLIDIDLYRNGRQMTRFRIIAGYILQIGKGTERRLYECQDADFLFKAREAIGARGAYFGLYSEE
jgi:hypothetical protein